MEVSSETEVRKRTYFRRTTVSQRRLLFETAEKSGSVSEAARRARVNRGTYYFWHDRYESAGCAGLSEERSRAPRRTRIPRVSEELRDAVIQYHREHPEAGCRTAADRMRQQYGKPVIGRTKVREIILEYKASQPAPEVKKAEKSRAFVPPSAAVHAPEPGMTVNIDLCVIPVTHTSGELPAVTLNEAAVRSPGKSAGASAGEPAVAVSYPGQVFASEESSYEEQIGAYVKGRDEKRASKSARRHRRSEKQSQRADLNAGSLNLRLQRRRQRKARRAENAAWQKKRETRRSAEAGRKRLSRKERRSRKEAFQTEDAQWKADKSARREQMRQREEEDRIWREQRRDIRTRTAELFPALPLTAAWAAVLVIVDNCTRQCTGVPLFSAGAHVTAEMIVSALIPLLNPGLKYVISDNGPQFIAEIFQPALSASGITHVRISPHRPRTNGIAERFVRTLKEWLEPQSWTGLDTLEPLLTEFPGFYNDRPHQGRELRGLSPNEYARRFTCSRC